VLDSPEFGPIAPYVVHSIDFGSEPVTDNMDGGGQQFVNDLAAFKKRVNSYGIPAGISEDWDRPGDMVRTNNQIFCCILGNSSFSNKLPCYLGFEFLRSRELLWHISDAIKS